MRVLLVHATPLDYLGGAELSLKYHVDHAPPGVRVEIVLPDADVTVGGYDAVVLGNLRPAGTGDEGQVAWAIRWADLLRGYEGFSLRSERDVHPCGRRDGQCVDGTPFRHLGCDCSCQTRDAFAELYAACSAVQFLSPAHRDVIRQLIPVTRPTHIIASPIDLDQFPNRIPWQERKKAALILGDEVRVAPTAEARARQHGFEPERVPPRSVPFERMAELYNRYQAVVVDPVMFHAFGRVAVEALSCGCRVIASRRVGAMSWPDPLRAAAEANDQFWQVIREGARRASPLCAA